MTEFTRLTSIAAPFPESDIDTDVVIPARFLLLLDKAGLGQHLFHERRHDRQRQRNTSFVLDHPPFDTAKILVAGRNFGCGSSREQAVWALADFGITCVIAPSFGEIFFANCFKNGVLPIILDAELYDRVLLVAEAGAEMTVDLQTQEILLPKGTPIPFAVDPHRRRALLLGLDEIGMMLTDDGADIEAFEANHRVAAPWLFLDCDRREEVKL
ncbi:3-isopropylmalate dehydratase small subunit [Acidisoma cellulosilytica]|uniref:3-isopropylmalate dehydratase small subunit n=1 Tax=Acidisoma cellulosilyticum TaxID=2802395 RepID=A0A963Z217_9PROT|nr:3-isopropylmalate dehydratase small subunit [Acidisoma cellulosilyticum]MCB8881398.1 3-isopropylmalate dehydratase small subunit [Acidisoma cellulosilyticum]